ncbi:MAG: hypothetical protein CUN53_08515 [Phototrophicales bacterium]|nr:MAG: hypothetical protein CUN53_08515 [Phototrophicales bacterium]
MKTWIAIAGLLLIVGIGVYAFNGIYSRYMADDYCIINEIRGRDLLSMTAEWYHSASGRVAQFVALIIALNLGVSFAAVSPALLLLAWIGALTWSLLPIMRHFAPERSRLAALTASAALIAAALAGSPQIPQTLYWVTGAYTYTAPLIIASFLPGIVLRARTPLLPSAAALTLTLISGTFSEPNATWLLAALLSALIGTALVRAQRAQTVTLGAGALGAALAILVLLSSPGNALRSTAFTPSDSVIATGLRSIQYALLYTLALAPRLAPVALVALFIVPSLIALSMPRLPDLPTERLGWALLLWIGAGLFMLTAFMAPGVHATLAPPPARAFIIPAFGWSVTLAGAGWLFGCILRARHGHRPILTRAAAPLGAALIAILAAVTVVGEITLTPIYAAYAAEWDARDRALWEADGAISVAPYTRDLAVSTGLDTLTDDPESWLNRCAADYYDLVSIRVERGRA